MRVWLGELLGKMDEKREERAQKKLDEYISHLNEVNAPSAAYREAYNEFFHHLRYGLPEEISNIILSNANYHAKLNIQKTGKRDLENWFIQSYYFRSMIAFKIREFFML